MKVNKTQTYKKLVEHLKLNFYGTEKKNTLVRFKHTLKIIHLYHKKKSKILFLNFSEFDNDILLEQVKTLDNVNFMVSLPKNEKVLIDILLKQELIIFYTKFSDNKDLKAIKKKLDMFKIPYFTAVSKAANSDKKYDSTVVVDINSVAAVIK